MRSLIMLIALPLIASAQASFPTEWPAGAQPLAPEALHERLANKVFVAKPVSGASVRTEYRGNYAYINVGDVSDSGPWRTEGSTVCNEWRRLRAGCSEIRAVGETLYVRRANNGEIMTLVPQ